MITKVNNKSQSVSLTESQDKTKFLYPGLIFLIWLITYILCTVFWEQKIGWDEVSYLTTARGIADHFDFSSRTTSIMGLIKYPFPQSNHHFPVYSAYLALFLKIFGVSIQAAYFSTWLAALVACFFIYLTVLLITESNRKFAFFIAISFLFFPRIVDYCDSAMMEIPGCGLVSILVYFIFKSIKAGKLNPVFLGIAFIWLYFFKSLFIGVLFGFLAILFMVSHLKLVDLKLQSKIPTYLNIPLFLATVAIAYFIFTKYIFLPLAPMMNFDPRLEGPYGPYADFAGGFFGDILGNLKINLETYFQKVIKAYYPYRITLYPQVDAFYIMLPAWFELGAYFLTLFYVAVFSFLMWEKLLPVQKIFITFTFVSIAMFNLIFASIAGGAYGLICRYNLIYVPALLVSFAIIVWAYREYLKPFISEHRKGSIFLIISLIVFVYLPLYYSANIVTQWDKNLYRDIAHKNSELVKKFIQNTNPRFVYFTVGTHTTWDSYPTRVIQFEATNQQIKDINFKLPQPIEYLFLRPDNNLLKENKELIIAGKPIINNSYVFYGFDVENKIIVYKFNTQNHEG